MSESEEVQALKEELHVALKRLKENQELIRVRQKLLTAFSLCSSLCPTGEPVCLQDLQKKMVEPSDLPLVEQSAQELRESPVQQGGPAARGPVLGRGGGHQRSAAQET